ncbi:MAG TPA: hypothetical protein VFF27_14525 [Bacteroidia bacterium]|jgi:hypothetical protein|nr:hypothetical protein [Bacteroidia bacterium]
MNSQDIQILIKKIIVGVIVYLVPLFIIVGGLLFTNHLLKKNNPTHQNALNHENRN